MAGFQIFGRRRRAEAAERGFPALDVETDSTPVSQQQSGLRGVYERIDTKNDQKIDKEELLHCLDRLGVADSRKMAQRLMYEMDEDQDGYIGGEEFEQMYQRAADDRSGQEPRELYNLVEFMLAQGDDSIPQLIWSAAYSTWAIRHGKKRMEKMMASLFTAEEQKDPNSLITFDEYFNRHEAILRKQLSRRKQRMRRRRSSSCQSEADQGVKLPKISSRRKSAIGGYANRSCANPRDYVAYSANFRKR